MDKVAIASLCFGVVVAGVVVAVIAAWAWVGIKIVSALFFN